MKVVFMNGLVDAVESSLLACSSARAFALSLLDRRVVVGVDGDTRSSSDVVGDIRHVLLSGFA